MPDIEIHIDLHGRTQRVGLLRQYTARREAVTFEYDETWLENADCFSLEPALTWTRSVSRPTIANITFPICCLNAP